MLSLHVTLAIQLLSSKHIFHSITYMYVPCSNFSCVTLAHTSVFIVFAPCPRYSMVVICKVTRDKVMFSTTWLLWTQFQPSIYCLSMFIPFKCLFQYNLRQISSILLRYLSNSFIPFSLPSNHIVRRQLISLRHSYSFCGLDRLCVSSCHFLHQLLVTPYFSQVFTYNHQMPYKANLLSQLPIIIMATKCLWFFSAALDNFHDIETTTKTYLFLIDIAVTNNEALAHLI